ncbi:type II secretion system protein [Herbaspirillum sp. YR522]|uniref:type II secretion system protein n=1 Tax=Herbaspirillum sp. YR522 TaxID=1144342 RepID=UPI00026F7FA2|nr:prepilin-type N-terminal cleavage/methylation domain-containing protein [Herbaspirillum sp. YR522]EJN03260.1 prepilin-type N-terminal cleavage/methylation domain-containing protein [Herbaspirillum sp. YR522]
MPDRRGFTLVELLVVMAIVALLATLAMPRYFHSVDTARETILVENLRLTRETIDQFHTDTGRYPATLEELVQKKYLKVVPVDPLTKSSTTWVIIPPEDPGQGGVYDLHSGAPGLRQDGTPFSAL